MFLDFGSNFLSIGLVTLSTLVQTGIPVTATM